jgi:general secretion pathway protein C
LPVSGKRSESRRTETLAFNMDRIGSKMLKKLGAVSPFKLIAALLTLFAVIQVARLIWTIFTPIAPLGDWKSAAPQAMPAAQRAALFQQFDPFFRAQIQNADTSSETITSLPITLFGIRSNEASGSGSAIIADAAGLQNSFATGEEIMPGVTLNSVAFDHVVVSNNGALEKLYLDQSVPAQTVGREPPAALTPLPPAAVAADTPGSGAKLTAESLARNVGLTARNENGQVTGLVVSAKDDGTVLKAAGLRDGDIIVSVNGNPVGSAADLAKNLRPGANVSVEVERGAQKLSLAIFMEKQ